METLCTRRTFISTAGAAILAASLDLTQVHGDDSTPAKLLLIRSAPGMAAAATDEFLLSALAQTRHTLTSASYDEVHSRAELSSNDFDVLIVPDAPHLPSSLSGMLQKYAQSGGHLALLGGPAFADSLVSAGGSWVEQSQWRRRLIDTTFAGGLVPLAQMTPSAWQHVSSSRDMPASCSAESGLPGPCVRFNVRDMAKWQWDANTASIQPPRRRTTT